MLCTREESLYVVGEGRASGKRQLLLLLLLSSYNTYLSKTMLVMDRGGTRESRHREKNAFGLNTIRKGKRFRIVLTTAITTRFFNELPTSYLLYTHLYYMGVRYFLARTVVIVWFLN